MLFADSYVYLGLLYSVQKRAAESGPRSDKENIAMGKISTADEFADTTLPGGNDGTGARRTPLRNPMIAQAGKLPGLRDDGAVPPITSAAARDFLLTKPQTSDLSHEDHAKYRARKARRW